MATNSYLGVNGLSGVNSVGGGNSYGSGTSGGGQYFAPASQRNINAGQIQDPGLRKFLEKDVGFNPINSYQKLGVAPLDQINAAASRYSKVGPNASGDFKSYMDPNKLSIGDNGYTRVPNADGYSYNLKDPVTGEDRGRGFYTTQEAIDNIINSRAKTMVTSEDLANYRDEVIPFETGSGGEGQYGVPGTRKVLQPWAKAGDTDAYRQYDWDNHQWIEPYSSTTKRYMVGNSRFGDDQSYGTQEEAEEYWKSLQRAELSKFNTPGELMEAYAQLVSGNGGISNAHGGDVRDLNWKFDPSKPIFGNGNTYLNYDADQYQQLVAPQIQSAGNRKADQITGDQSMVNAKPIYYDGKLIGYQTAWGWEPTMWEGSAHESYKTGPKLDRTTHSFNYEGGGYNAITPNDPEWYAQNVVQLGNGQFVSADKLASLPGFTADDKYEGYLNDYVKKQGFLSTVGPMVTKGILNYITGGLSGLAMGAAQGEDWKKLLGNYALNQVGGSIDAGGLGEALGASADWAPMVGNVVKGAGLGAAGGALNNGFEGAWKGTLTGGVSGGLNQLASQYLPQNEFGRILGSAGTGAARGALSAALNKGDVGSAMLSGAVGGGIGAGSREIGNYLSSPEGGDMGRGGNFVGSVGGNLANQFVGQNLARNNQRRRKTRNG